MSTATTTALEALHSEVALLLTERLKDKSATAADISAAIKFLKDNGIEAISSPSSPITSLARQFPEFDADEASSH